jgi:large subunit ribosomal protein L9
MAKKIRVILLEDVPSIGRAGDIVPVAEGYARNFLFNEGKAAIADVAAISRKQRERQREAALRAKETERLQAQAEQLEGTELTIVVRVKEGDDIFGSISAKAVAEELHKQAKITVKPKDINLRTPLTKIGSTDIAVSLSKEVETHIRVTLIPDPNSPKPKEEE